MAEDKSQFGSNYDSPRAEELSLTHAMKAADVIRRHFAEASAKKNENDNDNASIFSPSIPPGLLQGLGGFVVAGVALLPVRRLILSNPSIASNQAFRNFADLVISVGQALAATQVGLMAGSLYGGKAYLNEFANMTTATIEESNLLSRRVCQDLRSNIFPTKIIRPRELDPESYDPRIQTTLSMVKVIQLCERAQANVSNGGER